MQRMYKIEMIDSVVYEIEAESEDEAVDTAFQMWNERNPVIIVEVIANEREV